MIAMLIDLFALSWVADAMADWRARRRASALDAGKQVSIPCMYRALDTPKSVIHKGKLVFGNEMPRWQSATSGEPKTFEPALTKVLATREPTTAEGWKAWHDLKVVRLAQGDDVFELALSFIELPAVLRAFR